MTKIQKVSRILQIIFALIFIALPITNLLYWFYSPIPCQGHGYCMGYFTQNLQTSAPVMFIARLEGWLINLVPLAIQMTGFYFLIKLFQLYELGKIFTAANVKYIRYIGFAFIINEVVNPIAQATTSLLLTIHNGPGEHIIAITISKNNIINVLVGIVILLISWVMAEACKLQEEQTYTI